MKLQVLESTASENQDPDDVAKGRIEHIAQVSPLEPEYYLYIPPKIVSVERVIICLHGISRNALEQLLLYRRHADDMGIALTVPLFDVEHFRNYQSLGFKNGYQRADIAFNRLLNKLAYKLHSPGLRVHLVGYSGGAQFAHRWALGFGERLLSLHLCSPGWYTFPCENIPFPQGLEFSNGYPAGYHPDPQRLLNVPVQLLVGDQDILRDSSLNTRKKIDSQQGENRFLRAQNWFNTMQRFAKEHGRQWDAELEIMCGQQHGFADNMSGGEMGGRIEAFIKQRFPA